MSRSKRRYAVESTLHHKGRRANRFNNTKKKVLAMMMDLNKLKCFSELQAKVLELSGDYDVLVSFIHNEETSVYNPFLEPTGRFPVEPLDVYEKEDILAMIAEMKRIEADMGIMVEDMTAEELCEYLENK